MVNSIVITAGEPSGIGPDLVLQLAKQTWPVQLVVCSDKQLLIERAKILNENITIIEYDPTQPAKPSQHGELTVAHLPVVEPVQLGELNKNNAQFVLDTLRFASQGCLSGEFSAVVTAPVHKGIINDAGIPFSGHTEFFAEQADVDLVVMMLATEGLRVALVTTHIPLAYVSQAVTEDRLEQIIAILNKDLVEKFAIEKPTIYVCGLNPRAGEDGCLGREEIETITPTLEKIRQKDGINLVGPLPADTIFNEKYLQDADAVLGMYHDQVLPVLKYKGFGRSVNITLGLPFIRTSVDHGTALDLAGKGQADTGSFRTALTHAIELVEKKQ